MNRRHPWLLVLLLACVLLQGCGGGGEQPEELPDTTAGTQPVNCKTHPERCL